MEKLKPHDIYPEFIKKPAPISASQELLTILHDIGAPFANPRGTRYLSYRFGDGCSQNTPLHNPAIRLSAVRQFTQKHGHPPRESDLRAAFRAFHAQAGSLCFFTGLRIAHDSANPNPHIHLDPAWLSGPQAGWHIEITPTGWNPVRHNAIHTILPATVAPQPDLPLEPPPDPLAALDPLRHLLRLDNDRPAWLRVVVWLLAGFRPALSDDTPRDYPILHLSGPAASGKTAAARMLRQLVDPSEAPINFTPSSEVAAGRLAQDNHVIFIDGVTRLARRPAEVLARLSTGLPAKFHREMQNLSRPILVTTNHPAAADRLASRVLPVELPPLPNPLPQDELRTRFEALRPTIVGALLTLLSTALRRLPGVPLPENARFPESVQWAAAALDTLDPNELICVTRPANKLESNLSDLITKQGGEWKGTASDLKQALNSPLTARALSQRLSEIPSICVTKTRTNDTRSLTLTHPKPEPQPKPSTPPKPEPICAPMRPFAASCQPVRTRTAGSPISYM